MFSSINFVALRVIEKIFFGSFFTLCFHCFLLLTNPPSLFFVGPSLLSYPNVLGVLPIPHFPKWAATYSLLIFFKAFGILPLADVSSISFASIMIITILAIFILDEKVGIRRWIAIFFGFIGVLIVFRPGTSLFSYFSLLPLLGAVALSFAVIIMKKLLSYDTPPTLSLIHI